MVIIAYNALKTPRVPRLAAIGQKQREFHGAVDVPAAVRYIRGRQTPAGGFSFYRSWGVEEPSPADTYYALASLTLLGWEPLDRSACVRWLRSRGDANGGFTSLIAAWQVLSSLELLGVGADSKVSEWVAARTGVLFEPAETRDGQITDKWLSELVHFADLWRLTGHNAFEPRQRAAIAANLDRLRDSRGAFPIGSPNLADTATALHLMRIVGLIPDRRALEFTRTCEDALYGFRIMPHSHSTRLEVLTAGLDILATFDARPRYGNALRQTLVGCQHVNGGFAPQPGALPTLRDTWFAARILRHGDSNDVALVV